MTEVVGGADDRESVGDDYPEVRYLYPKPAVPRTYGLNELLSRLVGSRLQSVQFIEGYVQLTFDSVDSAEVPVLTCEVMPVVDRSTGPVSDRELGYADALRSLIGEQVTTTSEAPGRGLRIEFGAAALVVRPGVAELRGPVIAMLSDFGDGSSESWGPGSGAFDYLG